MRTFLNEIRRLGVTNPIDAVRMARNFATTVWDPTRSDIRHGINTLLRGDLARMDDAWLAAYEADHPKIAAMYHAGYDPELSPKSLAELPDGTLGREYARLILASGLDPLGTLLVFGEPTNAAHYAMRRGYKLHDVMHVALGCDTSILGEVCIVAFSFGQALPRASSPATGNERSGALASSMALAVLFLHLAIRRPAHELGEAIRLANEWMDLGRRTRPYVEFEIEDMMTMPVEDVRRIILDEEASPIEPGTRRRARPMLSASPGGTLLEERPVA